MLPRLSLALIAIALALAGCQSREQQSTPDGRIAIRVGYLPIAECGPLFLALENGLFAAQGLEVELEPMSGGAEILPAVQKASLDIGFSNLITLVSLAAERKPADPRYLVSIGGATYEREGSSNHALLVKKGGLISADDFGRPGFRVGLNTSRNIEELMLRRFLSYHQKRNVVLNVAEIPFPDMPSALKRGDVAVVSAVEPFIHTLVASGEAEIFSRHYLTVTPETAVATYCATRSWISSNRKALSAFRAGISEATRLINEDRGRLEAVLPKSTTVSETEVRMIGLPAFGTGLKADEIAVLMRSMLEAGFVETIPPAESLLLDPKVP